MASRTLRTKAASQEYEEERKNRGALDLGRKNKARWIFLCYLPRMRRGPDAPAERLPSRRLGVAERSIRPIDSIGTVVVLGAVQVTLRPSATEIQEKVESPTPNEKSSTDVLGHSPPPNCVQEEALVEIVEAFLTGGPCELLSTVLRLRFPSIWAERRTARVRLNSQEPRPTAPPRGDGTVGRGPWKRATGLRERGEGGEMVRSGGKGDVRGETVGGEGSVADEDGMALAARQATGRGMDGSGRIEMCCS